MKLKKEYLILLLVIAALSIYLGTRSRNQTHYTLPPVAQVDSQKINRLVITKGDQPVELDKKDDKWYIGPKAYPADDIKVKNMVKAAADLTLTDLISESGNYERYNLTDAQKINVQAFADSEKVRDFDIGKASPTYQHTFTRLAGDPKVYDARGHLTTTFNHKADDLRDMTVLAFEKNDISTLVLQKGTQSLTLAKKEVLPEDKAQSSENAQPSEQNTPEEKDEKGKPDDKKQPEAKPQPQWQDEQGKAVDQPAVEKLLTDFSNLKCSKYLADDEADNLKQKAPVLALTFKTGKETYSLSIFDKADAQATDFPALSSKQPYAFTIAKSKEESVEKQIDKLLNKAPEAQ